LHFSRCIVELMKIIPSGIRQWFGFTRRERRSSFLLVVLIVILYLLRYLFPSSPITIEEISIAQEASYVAEMKKESTSEFSLNRKAYNATQTNTGTSRYSDKQPGTSVGYSGASQAVKAIIDLNVADSALLESLPGIGPVLAVRTLKYRDLLGGFYSVSQLKEVYGLSEDTYLKIASRIIADTTKITKLEINKADYVRLLRHPYLEKYDVEAILSYRKLAGAINGIRDISDNKLIDSSRLRKIRPYIKFD
jgi:DNA uptake protein ComE-like DNA-binding protein